MKRILGFVFLCVPLILASCVDGDAPLVTPLPLSRLKTDRTYLRDQHGRYIFFHGVNVSGSSKVPAAIDPSGIPTYVGKPFPLEVARDNFEKLRSFGFNVIRLLVIWEGVEPTAKGVYDYDYLNYLRQIVQLANEYGIYVLMDMHQDMFSRHLMVRYNDKPKYSTPGDIGYMLQALVPDPDTGQYNDTVQGDGAPKWAVQACLSEKTMDSPHWGIPRILSGLNQAAVDNLIALFNKLAGTTGGPTPDWIGAFITGLPGEFPAHETNDVLPFTNWGLGMVLSLDAARCYGCLFAGDKLFPGLAVDGQDIKDYLQEAYANAWAQVAEQVADLPNVIGYDLINEPGGNFLVLTAAAGLIRAAAPTGAHDALVGLLGTETGEMVYKVLLDLRLLPPDANPDTLQEWGLDKLDLLTAAGLNIGFDDAYLRPFYERVGQAVLEKDPQAVFFLEQTLNISSLLGSLGGGIGGEWEQPMTRPNGLPEVVYGPHWYTDIYPFLGFDQQPRTFSPEEVRYRDYQPSLVSTLSPAGYSLGNIPAVFGEFGTYFNFNGGAAQSAEQDYVVSADLLDNYYEAFERMFQSRMLWCYSPENDKSLGDLWNHEDFSILDWRKAPRAEMAWSRPYARALAGKPVSTHFYSDYHYFDPEKGEVNPLHEFEVRYESKETAAPTEIVVPESQYPDGFYVWVSDGFCYYDPLTFTLYHYPSADEPGTEHWVRLLPPLSHHETTGWQYFFQGARVLTEN